MKRTAFFVTAFPLGMMWLYSRGWMRTKKSAVWAMIPTMLLILTTLFAYRWYCDPDAFFIALPQRLRWPFYGVVAIVSSCAALLGHVAFTPEGFLHRWRWYLVTCVAVLLVSLGILVQNAELGFSPERMIHTIEYYERLDEPDSYASQELASLLAACGREAEAETISDVQFETDSEHIVFPARLTNDDELPEHIAKSIRPWEQTISRIAETENLIVVMEAHGAPRHRQWIEQILPILHRAGFRDYAAEALVKPTQALHVRGYPTHTTGYYTRDPSFGNLLRTAVQLGFKCHAYESNSMDRQREKMQARNLAQLISKSPNRKFLVHAGYAHAYKTPNEMGDRLMAAHLWNLTGIEPYCIYQSWHSPHEIESLRLSQLVGVDELPVMLVPPPNDLLSSQLRFPKNAIDALVVHDPAIDRGPTERVHSFPKMRRQVRGTWQGSTWPVMIGAFKRGESPNAIALDQVLLRENERDCVLWVPQDVDYELRMFDSTGLIR